MKRNRKFLPQVFVALVALVLAGCGGSNGSTSTTTGGQSAGGVTVTTSAASAGPTVVTVTGGEESSSKYYLKVGPESVKAGPTTFTFENQGTIEHEVVVLKTDTPADQLKVGSDHAVSEDASVGEDSETKPGQSKSTTIDLQPGSYVLVCNIPRHYERGMYTAFTVTS